MSRISVIIPAYNAERFIGAALESVFAQTRLPDEVFVVDDASTDGTPRVLEAWQDRVQVIRNCKNSGPGHSRNRGIEQTTGDLLLFLDADDMMLPQHVEVTEQLFLRWPEAGMVISGVQEVAEDGKTYLNEVLFNECLDRPRDLFSVCMYGRKTYTGNQSFRRKCIEAVGCYREIPFHSEGRRIQSEDNDLFCRISVDHLCVASEKATVLYRLHANQSTSVTSILNTILSYRYKLRLLQEIESDPSREERFRIGEDRVIRKWECDLRELWVAKRVSDLRRMVMLGLKYRQLRPAALYYLPRALMPQRLSGTVAERVFSVIHFL